MAQNDILFITAYGLKITSKEINTEPSRTRQSFKDECNINVIMSRYMKTGVLEFVNKHQGQYGDVTGLEYQDAMQKITKAQSLFEELPSNIRSRFQNDPSEFLDFVHDPENVAELHEMGLMRPDYQPPLTDATAVQPGAPAAPNPTPATPALASITT